MRDLLARSSDYGPAAPAGPGPRSARWIYLTAHRPRRRGEPGSRRAARTAGPPIVVHDLPEGGRR